ncbi:MAG: membrane protein insertion efficiency factor YidD [Candidatus Subteraquimicrobiales bacterium]|nr:membrane protein insertion efficiency factor YidD [Candidatus Subteraquimicrobiales bacterium]
MKKIVLSLIKFYQKRISVLFPPACRFYPSCSRYTLEAVEKYGVGKGLYLFIKRISRCHPFSEGGHDPLK